MNCQPVRNRILALSDPRRLPASLAQHVRDCAGCKEWLKTAQALEGALTRLPVPAGNEMARFGIIEQIKMLPAVIPQVPIPARVADVPVLELPAIDIVVPPPRETPAPVQRRQRRRLTFSASKMWPAGLVAATLLIGVVAWYSLRSGPASVKPSSPADPLLDHLVQLNVELAGSRTPAERVQVLARVADELNVEMRGIARADASGDNMNALREMYQRVVRGLAEQAPLVERTQKEMVLSKVAASLTTASQKAEQMATESPEHSAAALREAAGTARDVNRTLQRLIREALS